MLTKYLVAIPLKQAMSSDIADALAEKFINLYTTKSKDYRSEFEFYK